jgi:uncharacterized protein YndB with AHSA1/START domain
MPRHGLLPTLLFACLAVPAASATVIDATPAGFTIENTRDVPVDAATAWNALVSDVDRWWPKDHSWWGKDSTLGIDPVAGGCFCERAADGKRSALHMTISFVDPGKLLRMTGGLGPLQGMGLGGARMALRADRRRYPHHAVLSGWRLYAGRPRQVRARGRPGAGIAARRARQLPDGAVRRPRGMTMGQHDPRVDAYIAKSAGFAQPILARVRELVHEACPTVEETIKWGMPSFVHAGGILAGMAAFKQHVSFGYWKHALVMGEGVARAGMGSYGRMASLSDLPPKRQLLADIRRAVVLNEQGAKAPAARKAARPPPEMPPELAAALAMRKHARARAAFEAFPPGQRREYMEWIGEAKREETRARRLAQALEWLAEGKARNWKYASC